MVIGITTPHADPTFASAIPAEVKKAAGGRLVDVPWLSPGAINNTGGGEANRYYRPDLSAWKNAYRAASAKVKDQTADGRPFRHVMLDIELVPNAPGHDADDLAVIGNPDFGAPQYSKWRDDPRRCLYAWDFTARVLKALPATSAILSIYGCLPAWVDVPASDFDADRYSAMRAVEDNYLLRCVGALCLDVYPWPLADPHAGDDANYAKWERDLEDKMRRAPSGPDRYVLLYFFWAGSSERVYVGDDFARRMLEGCRARGFDTVVVFEPPAQAWPLILEATRN